MALHPFVSEDDSRRALDETDEAFSLLCNQSPLLVDIVPDLREILRTARAGGSLAAEELLAVKECLSIARRVRNAINLLSPESFPRLCHYASQIHAIDVLRTEIERCIDDQGEIKDEASGALKSLRNALRKLHGDIRMELHRLIHSSDVSKALQEPIFTQRSGRYVLPVDTSKRSAVYGIVHDSSQSGLTVYIEPMSIVEPSNRVRIQEGEIEREIERIVLELSALVHEHIAALDETFNTLIDIDVILARARLATKYGGVRPELSDDDRFELVSSRHPLLVLQGMESVVPNDLSMGRTEQTLVITGPNTGGKTVLLKQAGLIALMVKVGLLIPAKPGSTVPIFSRVWADIGDEQSLVQSLSTFSSHMKNIVEIASRAGKRTLILLDEIGAGTDPKEGAALARAVLEHLNRSGATTITTTHFGELKMLAYQEPGFFNGSLEFDESNLAPTYLLRLGVAGSSKATTISQRLGLDPGIVGRARQLLEGREEEIGRAMEELERRSQRVDEKERLLEESKSSLQSERDQFYSQRDKDLHKLEEKRLQYAEELHSEFQDAQATIRSLIRDLQKNPTSKAAHEARQKLDDIRRELGWLEPEVDSKVSVGPDKIQEGSHVKIVSLNKTGIVESLGPVVSGSANALVRCGNMRVKVGIEDLILFKQPLPSQRGAENARGGKGKSGRRRVQTAHEHRGLEAFIRTSGNTLDLRGKRVDEAISRLEEFLDASSLSSVSPVMIIHGHGTGAVKSAVRDNLASSRYVASFRPGELYEGGDGVTIVFLT